MGKREAAWFLYHNSVLWQINLKTLHMKLEDVKINSLSFSTLLGKAHSILKVIHLYFL